MKLLPADSLLAEGLALVAETERCTPLWEGDWEDCEEGAWDPELSPPPPLLLTPPVRGVRELLLRNDNDDPDLDDSLSNCNTNIYITLQAQ